MSLMAIDYGGRRIGIAVSLVLSLTLVPADPFHGSTTWGVMIAAHYVAAPILLGLLLAAARIVRESERPGTMPTTPGPRVVRAAP